MLAADLGSVLFAASRLVHPGAIIAALILMFHPAANVYIRATRRTVRIATAHKLSECAYGSYGGATPQPQRGTGACSTMSSASLELCTARRVPHSA
jgi:hypothetical protein